MTKPICDCGLPQTESTGSTTMQGLDLVIIDGVVLRTCANGHTEAVIPAGRRAIECVALALAGKPWGLAPYEIKAIRLALGFKSKELAAVLGVSPHTVSRWEKGTVTPLPPTDRALRLLVTHGTANDLRLTDLAEVDSNRHEPMPIRLRWDGLAWHRVPVEAAA